MLGARYTHCVPCPAVTVGRPQSSVNPVLRLAGGPLAVIALQTAIIRDNSKKCNLAVDTVRATTGGQTAFNLKKTITVTATAL